MQVRKANRVVLAAAAAVVVSGLAATAQAQSFQSNNRQFIVSNGDDTLRIYSGGWSDPSYQYAIPLTTSGTQYGVTWNWTNSAIYVLEDNFIQVLWDGGSSAGAVKGPRWDIGSQGFDITYQDGVGGQPELYVTKRDSNIYVYNALTGAMKRTMAVSGASSLHGISPDWQRGESSHLTVGDWGKGAGGYRISASNGGIRTSWFAGGEGGLNYLYNGFGYMTAPTRSSGGSCIFWFYDSGSGIWSTGTMSSRPSGEAWDWDYTESTQGYMVSFHNTNVVGWWSSSQTSQSRFTTQSVNNPRGVYFKHFSNPSAPTVNSLISSGFLAGGFLDNNTPAMAATLFAAMSGANQTTALNTATPQGVANLISGSSVSAGVSMFGALAATNQPSIYNLLAATTQTSMFPALAATSRATLFSNIANTSRIVSMPTVAVTEQVSLFTPLALTNQTTVFNGVAASVQTSLFSALSQPTRATLFPTLAATTQSAMLPVVAVTDQVALFTPLAVTNQTTVFNGLAVTNQTTLFNGLAALTQTTLFPTLAETTQMTLFPTLSDASQATAWPTIAVTTQGSLFTGTPTISAMNDVTISGTNQGGGSGPTFTSVINNAQVSVASILTSLASNPTTVRGGQGDSNDGTGTLTLSVPIDYDGLTANQTLRLSAAGALVLNEAILDSDTGTARNLNLNLVARNQLTVGTATTGDLEMNADILLTGGALNSKSNAGQTLIAEDSVIVANGGITMTGASFTQDAGLGSITSSANTTGNVSITALAGDITLMNPIVANGTAAGNVTIGAPAAATITLGEVTASGTFTVNAAGADASFTNNVTAGNVTINGATGARDFGEDVEVVGTGAITITGDAVTQLLGTGSIATTANNTGNISITATTGDVTLLNPIAAAGTAAGNVTITGASSAAVTLADVTASGTFSVLGDGTAAIELTGAVDAGATEIAGDGSAVSVLADVSGGSFAVAGATGAREIGADVAIATTGTVSIEGESISQVAGTGSITTTSTGDIDLASSGDLSMGNALDSAGGMSLAAGSSAEMSMAALTAVGEINVAADDTASATFTDAVAADGFVVSATGAGTLAFDGAVTGGYMTVGKAGGTASYSTTIDLTGEFSMDGGSHEFASTSAVTAGSVTMSNGAVVTTEADFAATSMDVGGGTFTTAAALSADSIVLQDGTLDLAAGAGTVSVGALDGGGGTVQVRRDATFGDLDLGSGGAFNVREGAEATVSGSLGTSGTVNVMNGSTLNVDSAVPGNSAAISVTGGTLVMAEEPSSGGTGVTFSSGTIQVGSDATYAAGNGMARFMGSSLGSGRTFIVDGTLTLDSPYTVSGGRLAVADIANSHFLTQTSGSFELTAADFQVDVDGQFGESLNMSAGRVIELTGTSVGTITEGSTLIMSGGRFVVGADVVFTNDGDVQFTSSNSRLHGDGTFVNTGLVTGTGRLDVSETINDVGGTIRASSGQYLRMGTTLNNADGGRVEIQSAAVDITLLVNDGLVTMSTSSTFTGKPTLRLGTDLASINTGNIFISGEADFFGDMDNAAGGVVRIGGGGVVNFFDDIDNSAGDEFQVAGGSAAVFFSSFTLGTVTGDGTVVVMGTLIPRSNLGGSSVDGDLSIGETGTASFDVGDYNEFSSVTVTGEARLGGTLVLNESGYRYLGDTYDLFTAGAIEGQFENIILPEPGWGMNYELRFTGNSVSAVVVPEPATLSALAGLVALGLRRRRH